MLRTLDELAKEIPAAQPGDAVDILVASNLASSNGEARKLIQNNAISVNGEKIAESVDVQAPSLVKKGKNRFVLVR